MTSLPPSPSITNSTSFLSGIRGKPISGRTWKITRKKISSLIKTGPQKPTWEEKIQQRTSMKLLKEHEKSLKQEKQLELEKAREKRLQKRKQQEINNLRAEQHQVVCAYYEREKDVPYWISSFRINVIS